MTPDEYIAVTRDWESTNNRRAELIRKDMDGVISPEESRELSYLETLADAKLHLLQPPMMSRIDELEQYLICKGYLGGKP